MLIKVSKDFKKVLNHLGSSKGISEATKTLSKLSEIFFVTPKTSLLDTHLRRYSAEDASIAIEKRDKFGVTKTVFNEIIAVIQYRLQIIQRFQRHDKFVESFERKI